MKRVIKVATGRSGKGGAGQRQNLALHQRYGLALVKSQRHADSDFLRAARDAIVHHAVKANDPEHERETAKERGESRKSLGKTSGVRGAEGCQDERASS